MITYLVESQNPNAHLFNIRMVIPDPDPKGQIVSMPNWIPGSYLFRDYSRHIVTIEAYADEAKLERLNLRKLDNDTWQCESTAKILFIDYTVYAWDLTVEGAYLDQTQAFFNGCALFLIAHKKEQERCCIKISRPNCSRAKNWRVATTLERGQTEEWSFGEYYAKSYQDLIDRPVTMGVFEVLEFNVCGAMHYIVISGKQDGDLDRLVRDVSKVCENHIEFFKDKPPFEYYMFQVAVLKGDDEGGGLEHRCSSALMIDRYSLPIVDNKDMSQNYVYLLSLFSHEYFHAWNVKRIKPSGFIPYKLNEKNYTNQLWAFEGVTSYYADLALVRSNVITHKKYLTLLSETLTKLLRTPGRKKQTLTESSFDVWTKYNQPNENSLNAVVNYYVKGQLVGLTFDLAIRLANKNKKSFDDVIRLLWNNYGKVKKGVPEGTIDQLVVKLGGKSLSKLVNDALYTTRELPLEKLFTEFGLSITRTSAFTKKQLKSKGLSKRPHQKSAFKQGILGCSTINKRGRVYVAYVADNSAASLAGISADDEIAAINDIRVDDYSLDEITKRLRVGQTIDIHVFRQDLLYKLKLILTDPPLDIAEISIRKNINQTQKQVIEEWLS